MEIQHAREHRPVGFIQRSSGVRLDHQQADFIGGGSFVRAGRVDPEQAEQRVGRAVEYPDERRHEAREQQQRRRDGSRGRLGRGEREGFRRELTEDDVEERDEEERDRYGEGVVGGGRNIQADGSQQPIDQARQGGLADPAQRERSDGDSELGRRDISVQISQADLHVPRAAHPPGGHLVDLAAAGSDEGKLSRDEKSVEGDEGKDGDKAGGRRAHGGSIDGRSGN